MSDYHDHYLKKYVKLCADVLESLLKPAYTFTNKSLLIYLSSPGLSWHNQNSNQNVELEKVTKIDMYLFCPKIDKKFITLLKDTVKQITNT